MRRYTCVSSARHIILGAVAPSLLFSRALWPFVRHSSSKFSCRNPSGTKKTVEDSATAAAEGSAATPAAAAAMAEAPKQRGGKNARKGCNAAAQAKEAKAGKKRREEIEGGLIAERANITKLFMVSDTVGSIFCTYPPNEECIRDYLCGVDRAAIPLLTTAVGNDAGGQSSSNIRSDCEGSSSSTNIANHGKWKEMKQNSDVSHSKSASNSGGPQPESDVVEKEEDSKTKGEIAKRLLPEEAANYSLSIHVRDMEQLVPPQHIREGSSTAAPETLKRKAARRWAAKRSLFGAVPRGKRKGAALPTPELSSDERIATLREWQEQALARARDTQKRHTIPDHYHLVTRVRIHDPEKQDLNVVQGCGSGKSCGDVLAIVKKIKTGEENGSDANEDNDGQNEVEEIAPAELSTPFALRPLLSVFASCIPRREPALGARCSEGSTLRLALSSGATKRRTKGPLPMTQEEREMEACLRKVPPMPRYTTRVTVLMEHDTSDTAEIAWSEAPGKLGKKNIASEAHRKRRKEKHIYCLIADGGQF